MSYSATLTRELERYKLKRREEGEQEGWVVAYADLITLLFIFFSLLLSISVLSRAKFELLTNQFNTTSTTSLIELKNQLDLEIQKQQLQAQVTTQLGDEGLLIQFNEGVLFATAEAELNERGKQILSRFSSSLRGIEKQFHLAVEGHTDSRLINTPAFPSNWSLSSARGVNVLHYLRSEGIDEKKMMVRAYADTRPKRSLEPSGDQEIDAMAQNRRVTLLVH